jgi:two-component sensor histidine kinase
MEEIFKRLPPKPRHVVVRLGFTACFVTVGFLALIGVRAQGGVLGFFLLFPAIFLASVLFDRGSGLFATALSMVLLYVLLTPSNTLLIPSEFILPLLLFVLLGVGFAIISEGLRSALDRAAAAERAKDLLLQELGHRTKNNLAMVISVLSFQANAKTNPDTKHALEKAIARVKAIANAHEYFRLVDHSGRVEMRSYIEKLCAHLSEGLRDVRPIVIRVEADEVDLAAEQAIPIGLIVNELVTNSFKHAFPDGRAGTVEVAFKREASKLRLIVHDDGVGCSADRVNGLGSRLTRLLAQQLNAKLVWEQVESGCRTSLIFSLRY